MVDTAAPSSSPLADLLKPLEHLYQIMLNLTVKAKEKEMDLDKQISIEETRTGILEEAGQILEEVNEVLSKEGTAPDTDFDLALFERKQEALVQLLKRIQLLDQERAAEFRKEQEALRQELHQVHLSKQAVIKYQESLPIEE